MKKIGQKVYGKNQKKAKDMKENKGKAPIAEVDLDEKQALLDFFARYANMQPIFLSLSKASSMKELTSFIEQKKETRRC